MIKVSLDEAYVFDLLSIYDVKIDNSKEDKKDICVSNFNILSEEIKDQIGLSKYDQIMNSQEYEDLKKANQIVFDLVARAGESELSKITYEANYQRYVKKIDLQNKFFSESIKEIKI